MKLSFPICYNYLSLLSVESGPNVVSGKTAFEEAMGIINLVPFLGENFQHYFPCILIAFLILNLFELYGKLMKALGLENFAFILDISYDKYDQGLNMLETERRKIEGETQCKAVKVIPNKSFSKKTYKKVNCVEAKECFLPKKKSSISTQ